MHVLEIYRALQSALNMALIPSISTLISLAVDRLES
jgi:hypothetical protein